VSQLERRLAEAERLGFRRCVLPAGSMRNGVKSKMALLPAGTVREAVGMALAESSDGRSKS
jgi:DNA repair protein RadA/Sms